MPVVALPASSGGSGAGLPDQTGNNGKFLKTNGTDPLWESIPGGGDMLSTNNLSDVASPATAFSNIKQAATTSATGVVELATDGETSAGVVVQGNDARLSNARTPTAHATSHQSGGGDAIKLDDLATPDDNTDLNSSTTRHGLLPKLSGNASDVLKGDGSWGAGGGGSTYTEVDTAADLPVTVGTPAVGSVYLVRTSSGFWFVNRKERGLYRRIANDGVAADWSRLGTVEEIFDDGTFTIFDSGDNTKRIAFEVSGVTTGTTRTFTAPNRSGILSIVTAPYVQSGTDIDWANGLIQTRTLSADVTLGTFSNPVANQIHTFIATASGAVRTLTFPASATHRITQTAIVIPSGFEVVCSAYYDGSVYRWAIGQFMTTT